MNFWKRYPADYAKKTAKLTLAQHGAYTLLLDEVYLSEAPLPADLVDLNRICRAMTAPEREAVRFVAASFFPVGVDGLRHNGRAVQELKEAAPAIAAARANGKAGGRPKEPRNNPVGFENRTHDEPNSKAPQSSEKRKRKRQPPHPPAGGAFGFSEFWKAWPAHPRKVGRPQCETKWISKGCEAFAERVHAALEAAKRSEQWAKAGHEFIPSPLVWLNQNRWEVPAEVADAWHETAGGIKAKGVELGIPYTGADECKPFVAYRARVFMAAGFREGKAA